MHTYSKAIKRELRELVGEVYERELHRELTRFDQFFEQWRHNNLSSYDLTELIHVFHKKVSQELYKQYVMSDANLNDRHVAYAIVTGILKRDAMSEALATTIDHLINEYHQMINADQLILPHEKFAGIYDKLQID